VVSAVVGILGLCDIAFGKSLLDKAEILEKRPGRNPEIIAQGAFRYSEGVPRVFFDKVQIGDQLNLELTPVFKEWRRVSMATSSGKQFETRGTDIWAMSGLCCAFFLPLLTFFSRVVLFWSNGGGARMFWIVVMACEFAATLIFFKLILYWCGLVEKV
jgi:hypothetical protein